MSPPRRFVIPAAIALVAAFLGGGCGGVKESMSTVIQANRVTEFSVRPGQRVAVLTFVGDKGTALADLVSIEFLNRGVSIVERSILDRVIAEVRRTESGLYDNDLSEAEIFRQIGKITEADFVVFGEAEGIDPDTARLAPNDVGRLSPTFFFAYSRLSLRAFSTKTGEVLWWGSVETTIRAPEGNYVHLMDHLRMTARRAVDSMMKADLNFRSRKFERRSIPGATGPLVQATAAAPAIAPSTPPPVAPAAAPTPAAGAEVPCAKDVDCPGDLVCKNGYCAAR